MALAAEANDRNLAGLDQIHIRIAVIVNAHLPFLLCCAGFRPDLSLRGSPCTKNMRGPKGEQGPFIPLFCACRQDAECISHAFYLPAWPAGQAARFKGTALSSAYFASATRYLSRRHCSSRQEALAARSETRPRGSSPMVLKIIPMPRSIWRN